MRDPYLNVCVTRFNGALPSETFRDRRFFRNPGHRGGCCRRSATSAGTGIRRPDNFDAAAAATLGAFMVRSVDTMPLELPEAVRAAAGENATFTALPVTFDPVDKPGIHQGIVWRATTPDEHTKFVDPKGRTYADLKDFVDNNQFPQGKIRIPAGGQLILTADGKVASEDIDKASGFDFWHWAAVGVDALAIGGAVVLTAAAIGFTGGLAAAQPSRPPRPVRKAAVPGANGQTPSSHNVVAREGRGRSRFPVVGAMASAGQTPRTVAARANAQECTVAKHAHIPGSESAEAEPRQGRRSGRLP